MYDRHPSIKSVKSITVITRRVVSIDFYRLIDTIDNVYVIDIDSYRFIERFSDIDFYRLPTSGVQMADQYLPIVIERVSLHKNLYCKFLSGMGLALHLAWNKENRYAGW